MRTNGFASIRSSLKATVITQALLMTPLKIPFGFFTIRTEESNPTLSVQQVISNVVTNTSRSKHPHPRFGNVALPINKLVVLR